MASNPDPQSIVVECKLASEIVAAMNRLMPSLPPDVRARLNKIKLEYLTAYGLAGLQERVSGRTVAQVLMEYAPPTGLHAIEQGEREGVKYTLYNAPSDDRSA